MPRTAKTKDQPTTETVEAPQYASAAIDAATRAPRPGSKLAVVIGLLESEAGATIAEIMAATGWQQHTVRGALAGSITKKFARSLTSDKIDGRGRVYRTAKSPA